MRVLVTRPVAEARALAAMLSASGHEVLIEPLLTIEPLDAQVPLEGAQALALTSRHAVPALKRRLEEDRQAASIRVFAVGAATAAAARRAGFTRVERADGDASSVARRIIGSCRPQDGAIVHPSGTDVRPGLAEALLGAGFRYVREPVYRARAARTMTPQASDALRSGVDAVLLFSPRTAAILVGLVRGEGLEACLSRTDACCLSEAVAEGCRSLRWRRVRLAAQPDQAAMVELLEATG